MTTIVDFKILTCILKGGSNEEIPKIMQGFDTTVNDHLQKGYTLHGTTVKDGTSAQYQTYSQAVIKYSGSTPGPIIKKYKLKWCYYGAYSDDNIRIAFERSIIDEIREGYTLHGNLHYTYYDSGHSIHCYSQALVKISQPAVTFTEDLAAMRVIIAKQADSLADFQEEVANHNRAIAEVRLDLETQGKLIRRQKRLIDELTVELDNVRETHSAASKPTEVNLTNTIKPVVSELDFLDI